MAKSLNCSFKRVQFTPDLLPSDLTGLYFYNQKQQDFVLKKGPIMSNVILIDELNRATPRTQSALLECMEESQITIDGETIKLNKPFFVIAIQNPIEQFGTFPLPEAQLDRFFMRLSLGYPTKSEEKNILDRYLEGDPLEKLSFVVDNEDIDYVQNNFYKIEVSDYIKDYILNIVAETRNNNDIQIGASPRASLSLLNGSRALAAISGRDYTVPEDVKRISKEILSHRIILKESFNMSNKYYQDKVIDDILQKVTVPSELDL